MSKPNHKSMRLESQIPGQKGRTTSIPPQDVSATRRHTQIEMETQANRPVGSGGGVKRGDRRDMHPSYSTGKNNRDGGRSGPLGASGRKRGPQSGQME